MGSDFLYQTKLPSVLTLVTPTYLSRAVRQVSGRTVMEYINRFLLMEAIWLLESTDLSIDEIAERINYADSTTFGRFFFRMKGVTPREYRKSLLESGRVIRSLIR